MTHRAGCWQSVAQLWQLVEAARQPWQQPLQMQLSPMAPMAPQSLSTGPMVLTYEMMLPTLSGKGDEGKQALTLHNCTKSKIASKKIQQALHVDLCTSCVHAVHDKNDVITIVIIM